jgi:hypothetical protein
MRFGFRERERFAAKYRAAFGESPSYTLRATGHFAALTIPATSARVSQIRRIRRTPGLVFMAPEWLRPESIDEQYFCLLPAVQAAVTDEDVAMLAIVFGEEGELPARHLS